MSHPIPISIFLSQFWKGISKMQFFSFSKVEKWLQGTDNPHKRYFAPHTHFHFSDHGTFRNADKSERVFWKCNFFDFLTLNNGPTIHTNDMPHLIPKFQFYYQGTFQNSENSEKVFENVIFSLSKPEKCIVTGEILFCGVIV